MKNDIKESLIRDLKKLSIEEKVGVWKAVATHLEEGSRRQRIVNLSRISRYSKENEIVIVPGKVLGSGEISHPMTVVAESFSGSAEKKIKECKGSSFTIRDYLKKNPKGKDLRIIG